MHPNPFSRCPNKLDPLGKSLLSGTVRLALRHAAQRTADQCKKSVLTIQRGVLSLQNSSQPGLSAAARGDRPDNEAQRLPPLVRPVRGGSARQQEAAESAAAAEPAAAEQGKQLTPEERQKAARKAAVQRARCGDVMGALVDLAALQQQWPANWYFVRTAAEMLADRGDVDEARRMAAEAAALNPDDPAFVQVMCNSNMDRRFQLMRRL